MKKRLLSSLLVLCMVLGLLPSTVYAAYSIQPFTDVNEGDWFSEAVQYVYQNGLMYGAESTTFAPNSPITRGQIVTILHRLEGTPSNTGTSFTDVPIGAYYANAVAWASANGIMSGYGDGFFGPADPITREQLASTMYRYAQYKGYDTTIKGNVATFFDGGTVSSYAVDAVNWAIGIGLFSGMGNNMFAPTNSSTRAQAAMILMRFCENIVPSGQDTTPTAEYHTVAFDYNYGNKGTYDTVTVEHGKTVASPTNPTRSGYSFSGWYTKTTGGTKFDFGTVITSDMTLYAHWSASSSSSGGSSSGGGSGWVPGGSDTTTYYTVTFVANGDSVENLPKTQTIKAGGYATEPAAPSREGYVFGGWFTDSTCTNSFDFTSAIASNITLYAKWSDETATDPPETTHGEITYKAPTESDIDTGIIEYDGQTYTAQYVNNQLVVVFKDGTDYDQIEELVEGYGASVVGRIETIGIYQIEFPSVKTLDELNSIIAEIIAESVVEDAYLNTVVESEDAVAPYYPQNDTWDIQDNTEEHPFPIWDELYPEGNNWGAEAINAPSAWQLLIDEYGGISQVPSVRVGVIDTYIDTTHDDLENVKAVYCYQTGFNIFKKNQTDTTAAEYAAAAGNLKDFKYIIHGTHVTGTIGATFNNGGINGIAINPELYGVSVAEASVSVVYAAHTRFGLSTALSNLIEDSNCKVINYSMGYADDDYNPAKAKDDGKKVGQVLKKYIDKNYDFLIVNSAGNNRSHDAQFNSIFSAVSDTTVASHIIVVGNAQNDMDGTVSLCNDEEGQCYGSRVDVMAPGKDIYSTVSPNGKSLSSEDGMVLYTANSRYTCLTGTSMAAPHVTGVAALVWAANPDLKGDRVKEIIIETANIPVDGEDAGGYSHSMVNAAYAVSTALGVEYTANGTCGNNMTWSLDTAGNLLVQGTGEMTWDSDFAPWYRYREVIKHVKIEDGITSIYEMAFMGCSKVNAVELGNDIESIGELAFADMTNLHNIEIPNSVQEIGDLALGYDGIEPINGFTIWGYSGTVAEAYARDNNFTFIDITSENPDGPNVSGELDNGVYWRYDETDYKLTIWGSGAMPDGTRPWKEFCSEIKTVRIMEGITSIGESAFFGCSSLSDIDLPDGLLSIGKGAFEYCSSLSSIVIPDGMTSIGERVFLDCSNLSSIDLPDGLTSIGEAAFSDCSSLSSIDLPDGLKSIGRYAFSFSGLSSIDLPDGMTSIGEKAFSYCSNLSSVDLPDGLTSIGEESFSYCSNLGSIDLPDGLTSIGEAAFSDCSSLNGIVIPDGVKSIGIAAFMGCSSLNSVDLPDRLTSISQSVFLGCSSLSSIVIPDGVTTIGSFAFNGCSSLSSIDLPDGLTSIGGQAFNGCSSLSSIDLPDGLTYIDSYTFYNCNSLSNIVIPAEVTSIGKGAFEDCSNLSSIVIPDEVYTVDTWAFKGCDNLSTIQFLGDAPWFGSSPFSGVTANVYYPVNNATWTEAMRQNYDGNLTWIPY